MLTETGRVVAVEPDSLWVETIRQSTCGSCAAQKGCGHGLLNRYSDGKRGYVRVLGSEQLAAADCAVDDQVLIAIPEEVILRGSLILYMLPLFSMLAGSALATFVVPQGGDGTALLGACAGFALGFAMVRLHANRHRDDEEYQPTLLEVVAPSAIPVNLT
ncbi:MAG: SoxR reducing system RseC family protein [Halieaceae bacterium]